MTYNEAIQYMEEVQKKGSVLGLGPVQMLLERLDNPQDKLPVIHVAGTNGKGSICTFLESMYRAEGKSVGRYISPTIHCYLERFQINGDYMEEELFAKLLSRIIPVVEQMEQEGQPLPTAFEIETVIAFLYFVELQADIVILETGMGGRLDATNVVSNPICTVFASIGRDHMQFLGDTIEQIAYEKAGIIKPGCPVVIYPNSSEIIQVLGKQYSLHNTCVGGKEITVQTKKDSSECDNSMIRKDKMPDFIKVSMEDITILSETLEGSVFLYKGEEYAIQMSGRYQIYNAVTAIETKLLLDNSLRKESLKQAHWEGRFEKISDAPLFIRDGAHNVDGVMALKESIEKHFTNHKILFIIGVLGDKEYHKMMEILCPVAERVFVITPENERGLSGEILRESILPYCSQVTVCDCVENAIIQAKSVYIEYENKNEPVVIVAWGSLSYIGQIAVV